MTSSERGRLLAVVLLGCAVACTGARPVDDPSRRPGPLTLQQCEVPDIEGGGRCGKLEVYENRATRTGRKIALNIIVIPALAEKPSPDPVFWLEGGPGAAATRSIGPVSRQYLQGVRSDRDLVFVD